jgi:hypothetical protein
MGTYKIIEVIPNEGKFMCMVSFNGGAAEHYEVESFDAQMIADTLQIVADEQLQKMAVASPDEIEIDSKGQIVL